MAAGEDTRWFNEGSGVTLSQVPQPVGLHVGLHYKDCGAATQKTCPSGHGVGFALIRSGEKNNKTTSDAYTPLGKTLLWENGSRPCGGPKQKGLGLVNLLVK